MRAATSHPEFVIVGATASGKSEVALELCRRLGGEIVSMDSMKIYRGMDIGTAKPSPDIQRTIRHHLVDILDPDQDYSVGRFLEDARAACANARKSGALPIYEGGTALYLKALVEGMFEGPSADPRIRQRLEDECAKYGVQHLHAKLAAVDPQSAMRLHANDKRRVIRALEVHELTGRPISQFQVQAGRRVPEDKFLIVGVARGREELYSRIDQRARAMFKAGLVDEVKGLLARHGSLSKAASQALGYKETIGYINGKQSFEDTVSLVQQKTRNFAKHQLTWFRKFPEIKWVDGGGDFALTCEKIVDILHQWRGCEAYKSA